MRKLLLALLTLAIPSASVAQNAPLIVKSGRIAQAGSGDSIIVTPDALSTSPLSVFASPALLIATKQTGHGGGLISYLSNNATNNTNALPAAITAWGDLPSGHTGNAVFGGYSLASIEATTGVAVGHEITVRNLTGSAPDLNLPPNLAIGTTTIAPIGENLTCGGTANCSIGLNITSDGGSTEVFNTAIYVAKFAQYGLLVDSNGGATGIVAKAGTSGLSLHMKNTGTYTAAAAVADYEDTNSVIRFVLKQDGSLHHQGSLSASGGVGYETGAGAAVTQLTSKSTATPAINKLCGQVTMNNAALAAGAKVSFVVTNNTVAATDTVVVSVASGGTANAYRAAVTAIGAGTGFTITVENITAGSLSEAPVLNFAIIKSVAA